MRKLHPIHHQQSHRRRGFTFMEILFAVMILAIGFIMVAAMFPAALRQTQVNVEESQFNVLVERAARSMDSLALRKQPTVAPAPAQGRMLDALTGAVSNLSNSPVDYERSLDPNYQVPPGRPVPFSFHDPRFATGGPYASQMINGTYSNGTPVGATAPQMLWDFVRGDMIMTEQPQFAWVPLWARGRRVHLTRGVPTDLNGNPLPIASAIYDSDPSCQLMIFPVRSRTKPEYDAAPTVPGASSVQYNPSCDVTYNPANLDPVLLEIRYHPPTSSAASNPNAGNGVVELAGYRTGPGGTIQKLPNDPSVVGANPMVEGAYVIISDSDGKTKNSLLDAKPMPPGALPTVLTYRGIWNQLTFLLGSEVADANGNPGTSNGVFWSVAKFERYPTDFPKVSGDPYLDIAPDDIRGSVGGIQALVIGRQPDPADPVQHSDSARQSASTSFDLLNRTGTAQGIGYYPWTVSLK